MQDLARGCAPFDLAFHLFDLETLEVELELVYEPVMPSVIVEADVLLDAWFAADAAELAQVEPTAPPAASRLAVPLILATGLVTALVSGLATTAL